MSAWNQKHPYGVSPIQSTKGFFMKMFVWAAVFAAASTIGLSAASAAPVSGGAVAQSTAPIVLAQYRGRDHDGYRYRGHPRYVPGRRYHSAPHGWHRYGRRPGDWRHRGCVLVGPVWFCP
jgi:hypothetical protein